MERAPGFLKDGGIIRGALTGLSVWLLYGVIELTLAVALPRFLTANSEVLPWQWPLIAMIFGVYAVVGLLLGVACSAWLARNGRIPLADDHWSLGCLLLVVAFSANLIAAWPLARSEYIALGIAVTAGVGFCGALRSQVWRQRMAFLASPVVLSLLLLIGPWVSREALANSSGAVKTGASLLAIAAVVGMAALRRRIMSNASAYAAWEPVTGVAIVLLLWIGVLGKGVSAVVPAGATPSPGKPNILLITMDTVRADHLSVYGYQRDTTPYLRKFAQEATVYSHAIATDGFTLPTHASIFTGLYPTWHRADVTPGHPYGAALASGTQTLARVLGAHGYWTAEAVANYGFLGQGLGLDQGFEFIEANWAVHLSDADRPFYLREGVRRLLSFAVDPADFRQYHARASDIDRQAFSLLGQSRVRRRPFFLFLNYMDAHAPYLPQKQFRARFSASEGGLEPIAADDYMDTRDEVNEGKRVLDESQKRYLTSQYDGGIAAIDEGIGNLLKRLRELDLYNNTLIIVTSDHGEALGEHDRMEHGMGSVYQDQVHIPLLVKYPDQSQAYRSDSLVSQVDLMPTLLDWAGIAPPHGLQGHSLRSPQDQADNFVFAEGEARGSGQRMNPNLRGTRRAVFSGRWKLILWSGGDPELYDTDADPAELHNLYRSDDPQSAALTTRLNAFAAASPRRTPADSAKPLDKSAMEKLRSLGYVQ